jgi:hypothetical protein
MAQKFYILVLLAFIFSCKTSTETQETTLKWNQTSDSLYVFKLGDLEVKIDALHAGKIASVRLDSNEFLIQSSVNPDNWGNSLWPSPQSLWGWPPSKQLDKLAYRVVSNDSILILESQKDSLLNITFKKSYQLLNDKQLKIVYTISNLSSDTIKIAPWEITRVAPGGITLWPQGDTAKRGDLKPFIQTSNNICWFNYPTGKIPAGVPKLFADGDQGWLAQFKGGYLLVKQFENVAIENQAKDEAEIELYANPDGTYIEIEQQGKYVNLAPKQSIHYQVIWKILKTPKSNYDVGDTLLVDYIKKNLN